MKGWFQSSYDKMTVMNAPFVTGDLLPAAPLRVVVMGVSGCGKSTIAEGLSQALNWPYIEGDQHHPKPNIEKMSAGIPLNDEDRAGWLDVLAGFMGESARLNQGFVLTCSALKRKYRDRFRLADPQVHFIHLQGSRDEIAPRLALRKGHYMPPSLLDSQFRDLEPPGADEHALGISVVLPPDHIVRLALDHLRHPAPSL